MYGGNIRTYFYKEYATKKKTNWNKLWKYGAQRGLLIKTLLKYSLIYDIVVILIKKMIN